MNHLRIALWGVLPHLVLAALVTGTARRHRYDRFGFTACSRQLHESRLLLVGGTPGLATLAGPSPLGPVRGAGRPGRSGTRSPDADAARAARPEAGARARVLRAGDGHGHRLPGAGAVGARALSLVLYGVAAALATWLAVGTRWLMSRWAAGRDSAGA
ncbi:respiratory nitrate reductase subunit gamma [Streptomyces flavofungini]|uniref:respiratory nitrate reductase subunit gamma n=1 Tax=Streptomyces flavofungini TaxID=68200 RepID=UPI003F53F99D